MENDAENVDQKLVPDPFCILVNNPKHPLLLSIFFKNILKGDYQIPLKKLTLFFSFGSIPS